MAADDDIRKDLVNRVVRDVSSGYSKIPKQGEAPRLKAVNPSPTVDSPEAELMPGSSAQFYSSMFLIMLQNMYSALNSEDFESAISIADMIYVTYEPVLLEYLPPTGIPELIRGRIRDTVGFPYAKYADVPDELINDVDRGLHFSPEEFMDIEQTRRRRIEREVLLRDFARIVVRGAFEQGLLSLPTQRRFTLAEAKELERQALLPPEEESKDAE